jgi:hypothetical protein
MDSTFSKNLELLLLFVLDHLITLMFFFLFFFSSGVYYLSYGFYKLNRKIQVDLIYYYFNIKKIF